jgi:tetratricopeptide (TPR) repeat protein
VNGNLWIVGGVPATAPDITVSCHRALRGPYTGAGSLLRLLVPQILARAPQIAHAHPLEILAIAPELGSLIETPPQTLTELAAKDERTRLYSPVRTRRLAHGVIDLLLDWAAAAGPLTIACTDLDEADSTDQELVAILLRRSQPERLRVIAVSRTEDVRADLAAALRDYAAAAPGTSPERRNGRSEPDLLRAFIWSDGSSDDPAEAAAYQSAGGRLRAALHDERAAELQRSTDFSLRLGAIPYHLEHGSDPAAAVPILYQGIDHCIFRGFYHAARDLTARAQQVGSPDIHPDYWYYRGRAAVCHAVLGDPDEAVRVNLEVRGGCTIPSVHMTTSYALAMLYTRFLAPERRDLSLARAHVNNAIALASWYPTPAERTFHSVFNHNGKALVEMRAGDLEGALQLVTDGLARLQEEVNNSSYLLHKSVLVHNRAIVLQRMSRPEEAIAELGNAIEADPNYPEYHFDRGNMLRNAGRPAEAIKDYDAAAALSVPYWELHYNRAAVRAELGDITGAIADFARVTELEPDQAEAWITLVSLLLESGDLDGAAATIEAALAWCPAQPQLLCAKAQLALEEGRAQDGKQYFDQALAADGALVAALAGRATLAYEAGDYRAAIVDLTAAIEADSSDIDLLYNRAQVYQQTGDWQAAAEDYSRALQLPGADLSELGELRDSCRARLGAATGGGTVVGGTVVAGS